MSSDIELAYLRKHTEILEGLLTTIKKSLEEAQSHITGHMLMADCRESFHCQQAMKHILDALSAIPQSAKTEGSSQ